MGFEQVLNRYRETSFSERDKGTRFECLMKAFLKTYPIYQTIIKEVYLWSEFSYREQFGGKDTGIDLVVETYTDDFWAVQCKCYQEKTKIDKPEVDTFLSTSGKHFKDENGNDVAFSHRLWISTTNKWTDVAEDTLKNQIPEVQKINLSELENAPVDWDELDKGIFGELARTEKKNLRLHQTKALEKAHEYYQTHDRGKLIMACGTGKTYTSLKIAEQETNNNGLVLFLVPSIALLGQTLSEWVSEAEKTIHPICICSDPESTKKKVKNDTDDESYSVVDLAVPASTNVKNIKQQFDYIKLTKKEGMTVVFSTYQSIDVIAKAQNAINAEVADSCIFDMVICDEAHRTTGVILNGGQDWNVMKINGNDPDQIREALKKAQGEKERPTLIIGKTVMGKGALKEDGSSYEHSIKTHGAPLGGEAYQNTIKNLGGDPTDPFKIFDEVKALYANREKELEKIVAERHAVEAAWAKANPEKAAQLKEWFSGKAPKVDWSVVAQKENSATRAASAACLGALAQQVPKMVCASADLSNSDKTDGFLKYTKSLVKDDYSGAFFQAGVSELTMACMCIGMYLHGGVIPACGTFFVFSDYMKPAVRMAALMQVPIKFIWTHDAFRVGEDGPTHEPVEQEAQIRLMEKLKNHAGKDSVRVFRPADADETTVCWKLAMENTETPTALIFSRQNITKLPAGTDYEQAAKGAYIVAGSDENPDVILVVSGSEVSTLESGCEALRADGIKVRVVSAPSEGLFRGQSAAYQESVQIGR